MSDIADHVIGLTKLGGRPKFSDEAKKAMRLVESLVNGGVIELAEDPFVSGEQRFRKKKAEESASLQATAAHGCEARFQTCGLANDDQVQCRDLGEIGRSSGRDMAGPESWMSQLGKACWDKRVSSSSLSPSDSNLIALEQAIESTSRLMREELDHMADIRRTVAGDVPTTTLYKRLGDHLDALLAAQLKRVTSHD